MTGVSGETCLIRVTNSLPSKPGNHQVSQHKINATTAKNFEGLLACGANDYPVASGFEHQFSDGERLLVIIDAENHFFDFHNL